MKEKGKKHEGRLFTAPYILLMAANLLVTFGYSMISTLITSYAVGLGATLGVAGALGGIYSLAALGARPVGGLITDRWDKKKICLVTAFLTGIVMLGYVLIHALPALFLCRIINGAAFGIYSTVCMAYISTFIPRERLGEGLGYFGMTQVLAQVCGPTLGSAVEGRFGFSVLFTSVSFITLAACLLLLAVEKEKKNAVLDAGEESATEGMDEYRPKESGEKRKFGIKNLIALECVVYAITGGMFSLSNGILNSFLVLVGRERSIEGVSTFFMVNGLVLFGIRIVIGKIIDKKSLTVIVNLSLICIILSMIMVGKAGTLGLVLAAAVIKALGQGGGQISLQSACIKKVDAKRVGIATSTYYIGADIGQGIGPIIGGKLAARFGYEGMFYAMAFIILVVMAVFNLYQKKGEKYVEENAH